MSLWSKRSEPAAKRNPRLCRSIYAKYLAAAPGEVVMVTDEDQNYLCSEAGEALSRQCRREEERKVSVEARVERIEEKVNRIYEAVCGDGSSGGT